MAVGDPAHVTDEQAKHDFGLIERRQDPALQIVELAVGELDTGRKQRKRFIAKYRKGIVMNASAASARLLPS